MTKPKEYFLYDKYETPVVRVKWINVHAYSLKGVKGGPLEKVHMRINPDELPPFKKRFGLKIKADLKPIRNIAKRLTVTELLTIANYNINVFNDERAVFSQRRLDKGKKQLQQVIDVLAKGYDLNDNIIHEVEKLDGGSNCAKVKIKSV